MPAAERLSVFLSSTSEDLQDYRRAAADVVLGLQWHPEMQEHFGARPGTTVASCCAILDSCDLVLLLVAWRRGWVPTAEQGGNGRDSITALELTYAREKKIPVLVMLARDTWPGRLWEDDSEARRWVKEFRDGLNQVAVFFDHEPVAEQAERLPAFRAKVSRELVAQKERLLERRAQAAPAGALDHDFFESAREALLDGSAVPVVGCGVFAGGALGSSTLVSEMLGEGGGEPPGEGLSVATAAEYRERCSPSREQFLRHFRKALERHEAAAEASPMLELLGGLETLPLVVCATYDRLLERRLEAAGRTVAVVAHVLRSFDGAEEGKLLVRRAGRPPELCRVDDFAAGPEECVLYRPQGSPFLHDGLDEDDGIDTVVVTETDHLALLRRLESPETGVPPPIRKRFRRSPFLFLGYEMDMWHYRLMMQVFQSAGREGRRASTLAVREPATPIEEMAWKRLNADLIRMDSSEFARRVLQRRAAG